MPRSTRPNGQGRTRSCAPGSLLAMGLLDDAIREHLELKRAHGADPGEVAQLEREAFGPARRGPEPLEAPASADTELAAEAAEPAVPEEEAPPPPPEPPTPAPLPPAEPLPPVEPEREPADPLLAEPEVDAPVYEPEPERAPPPEPPATLEEPVTRAPEPPAPAQSGEPDAEGEDLLEETPEFLEETPEHDRLWFEQRPPRDFDFDG